MGRAMKTIPFFDDNYPIGTIYTDNSDWQTHDGWQRAEVRQAVFQKHLGIPIGHVFYAYEMDSGSVLAITDKTARSLKQTNKADIYNRFGGYDAMVTAIPNIMLCICTADCMPLFLYDPTNNVIAMAHCGWRGVCDGVVSNTLSVMATQFDVDPQHVIAAYGPCICDRCYEVGSELIAEFAKRFLSSEIESVFRQRYNGKYLLDIRKSVTLELLHAGLQPNRIHDTKICTYENAIYPSCRRTGIHLEARRQTFSGIVLRGGGSI